MGETCSICGAILSGNSEIWNNKLVCESCWCKNCSEKSLLSHLKWLNSQISAYEESNKIYEEHLKDLKERKADIEKIMKDRNFQE